jgi:hypothetical protein
MALATTASMPAGSSGRVAVTFGTGSMRWAYIRAASWPRGNGASPIRHSYRTQPSE